MNLPREEAKARRIAVQKNISLRLCGFAGNFYPSLISCLRNNILFLFLFFSISGSAQIQKLMKPADKKFAAHKFQAAMEDYTIVIKKYPEYAESYARRALCKFKLTDQVGALEDINKAISLDPKFFTAYSIRGQFHEAFRYFDSAVADFTKCIELQPNNQLPYYTRGKANIEAGFFDDAIKDFDQALKLNPDFAEASYQKGIALMRNKSYADAKKIFDDYLKQYPSNYVAMFMRGICKDKTGDAFGACRDWMKASNKGYKEAEALLKIKKCK